VDGVNVDAIDDSVVAMDDFAEIVLLILGDDAAGERERGEAINGRDEVRYEEVRIVERITGDKLVDRRQVIGCGVGPREPARRRVNHGMDGAAALQPEPALHFFVGDDSAGFDIGEALLDLVDEVQALHRVLEGRVGGKALDGLKDALLGRGWSGHARLGVSDVEESTP
jgi:hypothetical protein